MLARTVLSLALLASIGVSLATYNAWEERHVAKMSGFIGHIHVIPDIGWGPDGAGSCLEAQRCDVECDPLSPTSLGFLEYWQHCCHPSGLRYSDWAYQCSCHHGGCSDRCEIESNPDL